MAKLQRLAGSTSVDINIFAQDSSVATGAGLTGLAYNTGSLTAYYHRQGASSAVAITLVTKTLGTWVSGGFVVVDGTNMPGLYELGIPDAALASGAKWVIIMIKGASNLAPVVLEIELLAIDNQDGVRGGMTALPNGTQLALSASTIVSGAATATTLSTTQMSTGLTEATNDHYKGRVLIWTSGVLVNQAASITAYNGSTKTLTYTTTVTAESPSNGDTFIIV